MKFVLALWVAFACVAVAHAAAPPASASGVATATVPFAAVEDLRSAIEHDQTRMEWNLFQISLGAAPKDVGVSSEALKTLDAKLDAALAQAKTNPQILAATKTLYVAAQDYFTNTQQYGPSANNARLKSKLDDALNGLKIEIKLASP